MVVLTSHYEDVYIEDTICMMTLVGGQFTGGSLSGAQCWIEQFAWDAEARLTPWFGWKTSHRSGNYRR